MGSVNRYPQPKRSKYGNTHTKLDGHNFMSIKEATRYNDLKIMVKAGLIKDLKLQPSFPLLPTFKDNSGQTHRGIKYVSDFMYLDRDGNEIVEDVKSEATKKDKVYIIKKKWFLSLYPQYIFKEI